MPRHQKGTLGSLPADLKNQIFGNLTAIRIKGRDKDGSILWLCKCDCGEKTVVSAKDLASGSTKTCGKHKRFGGKAYFSPEESAWRYAYRKTKHGAKVRNLEWSISLEQFKEICSKPCAYCGSEPSQKESACRAEGRHGHGIFILKNGIDRINNFNHYTYENSSPCCMRCNWMKSDLTTQEFKIHIGKIYTHLS